MTTQDKLLTACKAAAEALDGLNAHDAVCRKIVLAGLAVPLSNVLRQLTTAIEEVEPVPVQRCPTCGKAFYPLNPGRTCCGIHE